MRSDANELARPKPGERIERSVIPASRGESRSPQHFESERGAYWIAPGQVVCPETEVTPVRGHG